MANDFKIGTSLALDGEKEFKEAVKNINKDLSVLGSEMGKVTAEFAGNSNSMGALTNKSEVLNKQLVEQKNKVETLKSALESAKDEFGENSNKVKDWQIQLNNAEKNLAQTENALKETREATEKLNKEKLDNFTSGLKKAGEVAAKTAAALGAALLAAGAGIAKITNDAAYAADEINTISKQTGLSTEAIQKFQYASEQIDVPLETLTGSMAKLTKNMGTAQKGTGDAANAFKALGVEITNQDGTLRNNQDVFNDAIDALGKMENSTQRDAYAMQIFGKSAQALNPLILGGSEALNEYGKQAEAAGLILGQDALDNLNSFSDAMDTFKATISGTGNLFATMFAGPMAAGLNLLTGYIQDLTAAFGEGGMKAVIDSAGGIVKELVQGIKEKLPMVMDVATDVILTLVTSIITLMPDIIAMGATILIELANGIAESLPDLIPTIVNVIVQIITVLLENLPLIAGAAVQIIIALAQGLVLAIPELIKAIPTIIKSIIQAFKNYITTYKEIGKSIVSGVWEGIKEMGEWFREKISNFFSGIVNGVKKVLGINSPSRVFANIGGYMAEGLGEGFTSEMGKVAQQINASVPKNVEMNGIYSTQMGEGIVNGLAAVMGTQQGGTYNINLVLDGKTAASVLFDPLRNVAKQKGVALA